MNQKKEKRFKRRAKIIVRNEREKFFMEFLLYLRSRGFCERVGIAWDIIRPRRKDHL